MEYQNITGPTKAQQEFIEREQMHKKKVAVWRMMLLVLLLAMWELCTRLGMMDAFIFSSPSRVLLCFWRMVRDKSIFGHIGITLMETLVSFLIVTAAGTAAAVALWFSRSASEILEPYLVMLNSLPKSALAPMLIVWLGNHVYTIVAAAVSVALFGSILTLHTGFQSVDPEKIKLIYSLGGSRRDVLSKVLLPGSVQHEGQHRALSGGRYYRRVSGGAKRAGIFDYLWESGISAGSGHDVHRFAVPVFYCLV